MMVAITAYSTFFIVALSAFQLKINYDEAVESINDDLDAVESEYVKPIVSALWSTNEHEVTLLLESITWHTKIDYAGIKEGDNFIIESGEVDSQKYIEKSHQLVYLQDGKTYQLGTLVVIGSIDKVKEEFIKNIFDVIIFWVITISVLGALFFLLFHNSVTSRLAAIAGYVRNIDLSSDKTPVPPLSPPDHAPDEIDSLMHSIHHMVKANQQSQAAQEMLRKQLVHAQKMESIGQLSGGIAHDFNNMLGAMLGYTELLKQICANPSMSQDKIEKYISEILTAGHRAKDLVAQMLLFSRQSADIRPDNAPTILIEPVITEVINLLQSTIPSSITIKAHIPDKSLMARIHPVNLHQIILNLVINARDAIGEYGSIDITLVRDPNRGICNSCHQPFAGEFVDLSVTDTGQGIPAEAFDKVFDPFFTTKDIGKGTGMGLSVVHGIVHSMHGHIRLLSQANEGTTISILLPLSEDDNQADRPNRARTESQGYMLEKTHVLVVDDEQAISNFLSELLQLQGATVTAYTSASDALAAFKESPDKYDVVITDETMPVLSGMDLAKAIFQIRPGMPIILCTGHSDHVNEKIATEAGIASYITKPIEIPRLISTIQELIRHP
jgi:signal transduction histidine kinase/CheY-like chemotaxis protein